ncbi:MAG: GAF domain-containing protein [Spirulina sp. SIO3F2]|nr:GAF domain-containing protein [Spirulina sp. SIO3F2]
MTLSDSKFNTLQQAAYQLASCTDQLFQQIEQEQVIENIIERIRSRLELADILKATSTSIRQLLNADRVGVFRFTPGSGWNDGEYIAEAVDAAFPSVLGTKIHDHCFGEQFATAYANGKVSTIIDIDDVDLSDCHLELLKQLQVRAHLIVPVLQKETLWGLLSVHQCRHPRRWQRAEISFVQRIAGHFAVALQQAEDLEKIKAAQAKALKRQKALVKIVSKIRQSLELAEICQTATDEVRQLLAADRVAIYRFNSDWSGDFLFESVGADWQPLVGVSPTIEDTHLMETQGGRYAEGETFAIPDIYTAGHTDCHVELLEEFQARAYAIAPIFQKKRLWGLLGAFQNAVPRQWQTDEVELLAQVGEQLGIAIQQADKQSKALNRQKALVKIVSKIRQSLELAEICQTATQEMRQLLTADRVAIYRFNPDWSGDFLFESVGADWQPLVVVGASYTIEDTHLMETQGGRYAEGETFATPDIYTAGHTDCHVELLEEFQARAYAIAPIFQNKQLWGLLGAFQNAGPRQWQTDEVELLAQVGEQLGIAIQQAEYVQQIQAQSQERKQLLETVKQSQLQLIQNEKMAGLGQMVAGIAHEINNPVNFIHGNLSHADDYIQTLLTLVDSYQQVNPKSAKDIQAIQREAEELELDFIQEDLPKILSSMQLGTARIQQIVLSLRNFSRLDEAEFKAVDIHEGIDSTLVILGNRLKFPEIKAGIEVIKNYSEIPLVECFPAQINQVFMNLLSNAIDALEAVDELCVRSELETAEHSDSSIWISTQMDGDDHVKVCIRDNGIGIKEANKTKIFNHFFTTKEIGQGTGLGLSISHEIISQKHNGILSFNAPSEGGAEFVVRLPIKFRGGNSMAHE